MAYLNIGGAESGSVSPDFAANTGTPTASTTQKRSGDYALRIAPSAAAQNCRFGTNNASAIQSALSGTTIYQTFWLYVDVAPTGDCILASCGSSTTLDTTEIANLQYVASDKTLRLVGSTTSSKTAAVSDDAWHRIDIKWVQNGTCTLSLDSATAVTCTGANNAPSWCFLGTGATDATLDCYIDDYVLADAAITDDIHVKVLLPDADGNYTGWTASAGTKWAAISGRPVGGNNITSGTGAGTIRYSATLESTSSRGIGGLVRAVKLIAVVNEVSSTTTSGGIGVRISSTDYETTDVDFGSTANLFMGKIWESSPATSSAWTLTELDGVEVIARRASGDTSNIRVYDLQLMVAFVWPAGTGSLATPMQTMAGTGVKKYPGTSALIVPKQTLAGTGAAASGASGTSALIVPIQTMAGTGLKKYIGTSALIVPMQALAGTGLKKYPGTGAFIVPIQVIAGSGLKKHIATGALIVPMQVIAATGLHTDIQGIGALIVPMQTMAGVGILPIRGSGDLIVVIQVVAGTGNEVPSGSGTIATPAQILAGAGSMTPRGIGSLLIPMLTLAATGRLGLRGTGELTLPMLVLAAIGRFLFRATGNLNVPMQTIAGTGTQTDIQGTGALSVPPQTLSASAIQSLLGTGALAIPMLQLLGAGAMPSVIRAGYPPAGDGIWDRLPQSGDGIAMVLDPGTGLYLRNPGSGDGLLERIPAAGDGLYAIIPPAGE